MATSSASSISMANAPPVFRPQKRNREDSNHFDINDSKRVNVESCMTRTETNKRVIDILAAIYYDVNYLCLLNNANKLNLETANKPFYRVQYEEAVLIMDKAVANEINAIHPSYQDPTSQLPRLGAFVNALGWKMLAICSLSEGFRRACRDEANWALWRSLLKAIRENYSSLEIFCRVRRLDWRGLLLKYTNYSVPRLYRELRPIKKTSHAHQHEVYYTLQGKWCPPIYNNKRQVNIEQCFFDPERWKGIRDTDPTLRRPKEEVEPCNLCQSKNICNCTVNPFAGTLMELFERPGVGVAVRALAYFRRGDLLGQFVAEICPTNFDNDPVYSLTQPHKDESKPSVAILSPCRYGNWTRFLSHSCKASTEFCVRTVGNRHIMTVEATKDIAPFEEVTIDYGKEYWQGKTCLCGTASCISRKQKKPRRNA